MITTIWNILIIDNSGTLIYSWMHPRAPQALLKKYEPNLIAGFISAILQFGHEVLVQPQRIDFGDVAMSFHSRLIDDKPIWFAVLSDSTDPRRATQRFLENFIRDAEPYLKEITSMEGFTIITPELEDALEKLIKQHINRLTRFLPEIRSDDRKAIPFGLPITVILSIYLTIFFKSYVYTLDIIRQTSEIAVVVLIAQYALIGLIAGYVSGRPIAGGINAYLSTLISTLTTTNSLLLILVIASSLGVWSGLIGFLFGNYIDSLKLTYLGSTRMCSAAQQ